MNNSEASFMNKFLKKESAGGIVLVFAAALAMVIANSPLHIYYSLLLYTGDHHRWGTGNRQTTAAMGE